MRKLLSILAASALICSCGQIKSLNSIEQVGDNPYLYTMEYNASYDLDEVLESSIGSNADLLKYAVRKISHGLLKNGMKSSQVEGGSQAGAVSAASDSGEHCTSFQARCSDGWLYGRNYDFFKDPTLVTVSRPRDGYASIAVTDMSHIGYSLDKCPEKGIGSKINCLAAIYAPVDGMNEKGLCTSIMALPKQAAWQDTGRDVAGTTILMRLWLDRCATVDEALELLANVDVRHDQGIGGGYHYMVADAQGNAAVVEFDLEDGWKTMIVRKDPSRNYLHVTNHLLNPKYYTEEPDQRYGNNHSRSWERYFKVRDYMDARDGQVTKEEALECLSLVHWKDFVWDDGQTVEDTQYSALYDQKALKLYLRNWNDYDTINEFGL